MKLRGNRTEDKDYCYDKEFDEDLVPRPYMPPTQRLDIPSRKDNPVVYIEIHSAGGRKLHDGTTTIPDNLGRLYFELRADLVPIACANFVSLVTG